MNKDDKLRRSVEGIDEKYIEEAYLYKKPNVAVSISMRVAVVAVVAAVLVIVCNILWKYQSYKPSLGQNQMTNNVAGIQHRVENAKEVYYSSLEELEAEVTLIVKGVKLDEEVAGSNHTLSKFKINEIYSDQAEIYKVGDVIDIYENEVYIQEQNVINHICGYDMMKVGNEYLLLLWKVYSNEDIYMGGNYGTVSLEEDGRYSEDSMGGQKVNTKDYENIWNEAKEKYVE